MAFFAVSLAVYVAVVAVVTRSLTRTVEALVIPALGTPLLLGRSAIAGNSSTAGALHAAGLLLIATLVATLGNPDLLFDRAMKRRDFRRLARDDRKAQANLERRSAQAQLLFVALVIACAIAVSVTSWDFVK